ncbi:hypothetical protein [Mycolicibacterium fortuitum]|uniref:vWA-MoxR associated conflict system protein n=1 Tax=Mycolicibacterium fortuitum TaxID=1766 RepID=UPI0007EBE9B7|nr:hypothetical protein [Mycolicibacterium fortuitum]
MSMGKLDRLETVASQLRDALLDPALGSCEGALADGEAMLSGNIAVEDMWVALKEATDHAAKNGAVLMVALLGHGFIPGQSPHLYFMGAESVEGHRGMALDVNQMLLEAVDTNGISGVVAIIDTCTAAGALPNLQDLAAGSRGGRVNLHLLLSSALEEEAHDLRMSREIVDIIREGMRPPGDVLSAQQLMGELTKRIPSQRITANQFSGDYPDNLWVSRNRLMAVNRPRGVVGSIALKSIRDALGKVGLDDQRINDVAAGQLDALDGLAASLPNGSAARTRAEQLARKLHIACSTVRFLRAQLSPALSTVRLRRALASVHRLSGIPLPTMVERLEDEVDFTEHIVFGMAGPRRSSRLQIVRFVAVLASEIGFSLDEPAYIHWALDIGATVETNDVVAELATDSSGQRFRLVVSLHETFGADWPGVVHAWVVLDGREVDHQLFDTAPSQAGAETALLEAVNWAEQHASNIGLYLRRIDIAAPAMILAAWRPEEVHYGTKLGVTYDIVWRWSMRINPPLSMKWMEPRARRILEALSASDTTDPIDWISTANQSTPKLVDQLQSGAFRKAIGVTDNAVNMAELLHLLLQYSPIVVWPIDGGKAEELHRNLVKDYWQYMPGAFMLAYREHWRHNKAHGISELRGVWDDVEWLDFCRFTHG